MPEDGAIAMRGRVLSSGLQQWLATVNGALALIPDRLLMSVSGSPSGRLVSWWPPAGKHCCPPGLEPCEKTVPLPVTGRVDRCWDVVPRLLA